MPHRNDLIICAICPHWHGIHGTVGQCRLQNPHLEADSVFAYPITHENQACIHAQPPALPA